MACLALSHAKAAAALLSTPLAISPLATLSANALASCASCAALVLKVCPSCPFSAIFSADLIPFSCFSNSRSCSSLASPSLANLPMPQLPVPGVSDSVFLAPANAASVCALFRPASALKMSSSSFAFFPSGVLGSSESSYLSTSCWNSLSLSPNSSFLKSKTSPLYPISLLSLSIAAACFCPPVSLA